MVVVTGAAGFIGSNLVHTLCAQGFEVLAVDFSDAPGQANLLRTCVRQMQPDAFLRQFGSLGKIECVFHQGACADTTVSDVDFVERWNVRYTIELLELCQHSHTRCIYASTAAVYGMGTNGFREVAACENPLNLYAASKLRIDNWFRAAAPKFSSQVVGLRYFNVYGPQENHKGRMASVIWQFHKQWRENQGISLFSGSENFRRDFIHVSDVVSAILHFFAHPEISGIFNVGTGEAHSFRHIAEILSARYNNAPIHEVPFPADLQGKYQAYTCADLDNLQHCGYSPTCMPPAVGVPRYAELLETRQGYLNV